MIGLIGFLLLALFFGIYAMVLELRGIRNFDQIVLATMFGIFAFLIEGK
jgi:hypothetical protein